MVSKPSCHSLINLYSAVIQAEESFGDFLVTCMVVGDNGSIGRTNAGISNNLTIESSRRIMTEARYTISFHWIPTAFVYHAVLGYSTCVVLSALLFGLLLANSA